MIAREEQFFNSMIGLKIKLRRKELKLTQTFVGQALNVTFQQIQKYEKGTNSVSAKKVADLAKVLKTSVLYFYDVPNIEMELENDQSKS